MIANWSVQKSLEDMDKGGVATAILSGNAPQVRPLGKEAATRVARESNEYAKQLAMDYPGRFGVFAMLPLPHIDEALREVTYALDILKADGIVVLTNYGDKWLGYSYFDSMGRRHDAQYRELDFQRRVAEIPGHQLDLLARRRWSDRFCGTTPGADG